MIARIAPGAPASSWEAIVPGSKSITNRALLLAGVSDGVSTVSDALRSDDTDVMGGALQALGAEIADIGDEAAEPLSVGGLAGPPTGSASLWCGMAGTVGRFLVPMLASGAGQFVVDAHEQLRRRPLGPVLDALRRQGTRIDGEAFPLEIRAAGLSGGDVEVDGSVSSQFVSGLVMAAPFAREPTTLRFEKIVSRPYLELTFEAMRAFGVNPELGERAITINPGQYRATDFVVEPDASTASYFLASAALTGTTVTVPGLDLSRTRQGDSELALLLERMGCAVAHSGPLQLTGPSRLRGVEVEMSGSSDVFMTLACVAPFADGPTTIEGIGHARVKESDRIAATAENLTRLGIEVEEGADFIRVHPGTPRTARLPTFDDHRIAMAFSLIGTRTVVELEHPMVVSKTFPEFFESWPVTGAVVELIEDADMSAIRGQTTPW